MNDWIDMGHTMEQIAPGVAESRKWYPSLDIDLKKAPELSKDVGETCVFLVKGKVVSKRLDEQSKSQSIEIREISVPEREKSRNEADEALESLKSSRRY